VAHIVNVKGKLFLHSFQLSQHTLKFRNSSNKISISNRMRITQTIKKFSCTFLHRPDYLLFLFYRIDIHLLPFPTRLLCMGEKFSIFEL